MNLVVYCPKDLTEQALIKVTLSVTLVKKLMTHGIDQSR